MPGEKLPGEGRRKQVKVVCLVGGKVKRKQEKGREYGLSRKGKKKSWRKIKWLLQVLTDFLLVNKRPQIL